MSEPARSVAALSPEVVPLGWTTPGGPDPAYRVGVALDADPELADLWSIHGDLLIVLMSAHHLEEPAIQGPEFLYLRRACWETAIIAYGRCFQSGQSALTGGTRKTLRDMVAQLPLDLGGCHDQVLALRNKRIGHHVAVESGQAVSIYLGGSEKGKGHVDLTDVYVHVETELYDPTLLRDLERLAQHLLKEVGATVLAARKRVFELAQRQPDEVLRALKEGSEWSPIEDGVVLDET